MHLKWPIAKLYPDEQNLSWHPFSQATSIKIGDSNEEVSKRGRLDAYWKKNGFKEYFKATRRPALNVDRIVKISSNTGPILSKFSIKAIEFGNWVNENYRVNYLYCLVSSLYDLNKVLSFNYNIGLDKTLSIAFGARGMGGHTVAHYEPGNAIINLTRFSSDTDQGKESAFANTGGMGAFAHEYGHFLDYFFGTYIDQSTTSRSLTIGRYSGVKFATKYPKDSLRGLMQEVLIAIIYSKEGVYSPYYNLLRKKFAGKQYFFRHNELFARAFEQYVQHKLLSAGIQNKFLSKTKYVSDAYMMPGDLARVIPKIDALVKVMGQYARKK